VQPRRRAAGLSKKPHDSPGAVSSLQCLRSCAALEGQPARRRPQPVSLSARACQERACDAGRRAGGVVRGSSDPARSGTPSTGVPAAPTPLAARLADPVRPAAADAGVAARAGTSTAAGFGAGDGGSGGGGGVAGGSGGASVRLNTRGATARPVPARR